MINTYDILETIRMIQDECLDIRTTTMGISLIRLLLQNQKIWTKRSLWLTQENLKNLIK